jgi:hypothetical protein
MFELSSRKPRRSATDGPGWVRRVRWSLWCVLPFGRMRRTRRDELLSGQLWTFLVLERDGYGVVVAERIVPVFDFNDG